MTMPASKPEFTPASGSCASISRGAGEAGAGAIAGLAWGGVFATGVAGDSGGAAWGTPATLAATGAVGGRMDATGCQVSEPSSHNSAVGSTFPEVRRFVISSKP